MTVKELIDKLKDFDQDLEVVHLDYTNEDIESIEEVEIYKLFWEQKPMVKLS